MRRLRFLVLATLALALAAGGIAIARSGGAGKIETASATFTAASVEKKTRTCQGTDGTYEITHAKYQGDSTGDPRLTGKLTIRAKTVLNLTTGLGFIKGQFKVRDENAEKAKAVAGFAAVITDSTKLNGLMRGSAKQENGRAHLLANFSAEFNAERTQLNGELGADTPVAPTNSAIFVSGHCENENAATQENEGEHRGRKKGRRRGGRGHDNRGGEHRGGKDEREQD